MKRLTNYLLLLLLSCIRIESQKNERDRIKCQDFLKHIPSVVLNVCPERFKL